MGCTTLTVTGVIEPTMEDYGLQACVQHGSCTPPSNCKAVLGEYPEAAVYFKIKNSNAFSIDVVVSARVDIPIGGDITVQESATISANTTKGIWAYGIPLDDEGSYTITQRDVSRID